MPALPGERPEVRVHPSAVVAPGAELAPGVEIGPHCVIGPGVVIGEGTVIGPLTVVNHTTLGRDCVVLGAMLGGDPQDAKFRGEPTRVVIGDRNQIREFVTIHRASGEGTVTLVGDDNLIMANSHLAHNCRVGNGCMLASYAGMSGHTTIEDGAIIGGMVGSVQRVTVGKLAICSGYSKLSEDVPPFVIADGRPARVKALNIIGLRRAEIPPERRRALQQAFRLLYRSKLNRSRALERINAEVMLTPEVSYLLEFLERMRGHRGARQADLVPES